MKKGKLYAKPQIFKAAHRLFSATLSCNLVEGLMNQPVIYESRRAQRSPIIAVKVQDEIPLIDGNFILFGSKKSSSEMSTAKDSRQTWSMQCDFLRWQVPKL